MYVDAFTPPLLAQPRKSAARNSIRTMSRSQAPGHYLNNGLIWDLGMETRLSLVRCSIKTHARSPGARRSIVPTKPANAPSVTSTASPASVTSGCERTFSSLHLRLKPSTRSGGTLTGVELAQTSPATPSVDRIARHGADVCRPPMKK